MVATPSLPFALEHFCIFFYRSVAFCSAIGFGYLCISAHSYFCMFFARLQHSVSCIMILSILCPSISFNIPISTPRVTITALNRVAVTNHASTDLGCVIAPTFETLTHRENHRPPLWTSHSARVSNPPTKTRPTFTKPIHEFSRSGTDYLRCNGSDTVVRNFTDLGP